MTRMTEFCVHSADILVGRGDGCSVGPQVGECACVGGTQVLRGRGPDSRFLCSESPELPEPPGGRTRSRKMQERGLERLMGQRTQLAGDLCSPAGVRSFSQLCMSRALGTVAPGGRGCPGLLLPGGVLMNQVRTKPKHTATVALGTHGPDGREQVGKVRLRFPPRPEGGHGSSSPPNTQSCLYPQETQPRAREGPHRPPRGECLPPLPRSLSGKARGPGPSPSSTPAARSSRSQPLGCAQSGAQTSPVSEWIRESSSSLMTTGRVCTNVLTRRSAAK